MSKSDLHIDILGTDFTISTDEESEYLDKLLSKYRRTVESVQQKTGLTDTLKLAVLTGFLLCDDLEKASNAPEPAKNEDQGEAERLTLGMISRLDELCLQDTSRKGASDLRSAAQREEEQREEEQIENNNFPSAPLRSLREKNGNKVFRLQNTIKNYDWGSAEWIPALLGQRNISRIPWAELWMGVNPAGPSHLVESGEEGTDPALLLSELIEQDKTAFLGKETGEKYGKLPFLFKVLAAAKPLSIQVHPNREQAVEGFERENSDGIPIDAPNRNYRDPNHKPEIICALGPFTALCGFRDTQGTSFLFQILLQILNLEGERSEIVGAEIVGAEIILKKGFERLISALEQEENQYRTFITALFSMEKETFLAFDLLIKDRQEQLERDFPEYKGEWGLCVYLSSLFPGDPGVLAPLYLNIVEMSPCEAMFLPAGVFHSYIYGLGIELMADSDNVLRGGLSSKFVDTEELLRVLQFSAYKPKIIKAPSPAPSWFSYPTPSEEFTLSLIQCAEGSIKYQVEGPSILFITMGIADVADGTTPSLSIKSGESVFIPDGKSLELTGTFTAYSASTKT